MALTSIIVSKKTVSKIMGGQWSITWELKGLDENSIELFTSSFSEDYKQDDNISRVTAGFAEQMQSYIDKYKKEQQLLNATAHDTAVANVQAVLEV
jgi:hypothetical protein